MPGAELHSLAGGTLPWLETQLTQLAGQSATIVFLQHHPYRSPFYADGQIMAFSRAKRARIERLLRRHSSLNYFGVFAGHFHRWSEGAAFERMPRFREVRTEASKRKQAIALVTASVRTGRIVRIQKLYGDEPRPWWSQIAKKLRRFRL